jgi:hypothetical protein
VAGAKHLALYSNDIADVPFFELGVVFFPDLVHVDIDLNLAAASSRSIKFALPISSRR